MNPGTWNELPPELADMMKDMLKGPPRLDDSVPPGVLRHEAADGSVRDEPIAYALNRAERRRRAKAMPAADAD